MLWSKPRTEQEKINRFLRNANSHGYGSMVIVLMIVFAGAVAIALVSTLLSGYSVQASIDKLEDNGYTVLTTGEYNTLVSKLDDIASKALAAAIKADVAASAANETLNTLLRHNENEVFLWPDSVAVNATLISGSSADTFGAWAELIDTDGNHFSDNLSLQDGYIREIMTHNYSANATDKKFVIELATDSAGVNVIGRVKVWSDWTYVLSLNSEVVTAGSTLWYRMKSEVAGAILRADFRYYYR